MKILVTGAAGFIGSHLCERLLKDHKVVGVDNLSLGLKENLKSIINNNNFAFHQCDILDHKAFENVFRTHTINAVFHLAANSDISKGDPENDFRNTLSTTLVVLEKCRIRGIKEFIFTSSGSVYGERDEVMCEDSKLRPISHYAAAKMSSEAFISSYCYMYGIRSWILRLPNVIGSRMTHGALFDWKNKLKFNSDLLTVLGDGNQSKPYMYIDELIDAMLFIWQNAKEQVNYFNISGRGETKISDMARWFAGNTKIVFQNTDRGWNGDIPKYKCSIDRLKSLGWEPKMTSDEAVKLTIKKL